MNLAETLRVLARRWYILLVGVLLAAGAVIGVWTKVPPRFERTATQVLLPGKKSLPLNGQNPYLYLGGLTLAADVVVRAVGSDNIRRDINEQHPGTEVEVSRDPTTAGPVILLSVSSTRDEVAADVLRQLTLKTAQVLGDLQQEERIPTAERMTVVTLTIDAVGVLRDRTRLALSVGAGVGVIALTLLAAALTEGIIRRRKRRRAVRAKDVGDSSTPRRGADSEVATAAAASTGSGVSGDEAATNDRSPEGAPAPDDQESRDTSVGAVPGDETYQHRHSSVDPAGDADSGSADISPRVSVDADRAPNGVGRAARARRTISVGTDEPSA